jgi:Domain of unknown function (DUF4279)
MTSVLLLAMSMTKSTEEVLQNTAFATLRFRGDRLNPDRITAILGVRPTKAYRRGERYFAGPRAGHVTGRTGVWVFATDSIVEGPELDRHLEHLVEVIFRAPNCAKRLKQLHELMSRDGVEADVSCFWRGGPGTRRPVVPAGVINKLDQVPAEIETDFEVNDL